MRKLGNILRGFGKNPTEQEVHFLKYDNGLDGKAKSRKSSSSAKGVYTICHSTASEFRACDLRL